MGYDDRGPAGGPYGRLIPGMRHTSTSGDEGPTRNFVLGISPGQRDALAALGVSAERTYVDLGLTGTNRDRPGLRQALAACRAGDTLIVTKLDRLARSLPDARSIADCS